MSENIAENTEATAASAPVVEVNTSGWHKPCEDAYPSADIVRECKQRGIPMTINADAHLPEHLLRDFDNRCAASIMARASRKSISQPE